MAATCPRCGYALEETEGHFGRGAEGGGTDLVTAPAATAAPPGREAPAWPLPTPPIVAPPAPRRRPAGFWIRAGALLLDGLFLLAVQAALRVVAWLVFGPSSARAVRAALQGFTVALGVVYPVIFHWRGGQTLGKMVTGIRVVAVGGGPLTLGQAVLRQIGYWISALALGIGYLMAGVRRDKRALHDLIAGTRVERLS
jgi:uncharacterized RDD family membrane protein YckC